jgi:hypothetical protein|tara:strand:+ start:555 stop:821 length:267 start_codon:yes stop_codon:yes gene_type:complete
MKNIMGKLQQYITIVGIITAIGGGFYTWGQFNLRLDNIEKKKVKSVNIAPLQESIATLSTKVDSLEKRLDRTESRVDSVGNNDNPLAR